MTFFRLRAGSASRTADESGCSFGNPSAANAGLRCCTSAASSRDGVLPESLSADFLAKAMAIRDDSADTVKAHAIAFSAAFHQHKDSEAANGSKRAWRIPTMPRHPSARR